MNEQLHTMLDGGEAPRSFGSAAEEREFSDHRRLQQELRNNAQHGGLTAAEKSAMGTSLAAIIGYDEPVATPSTAAGGWLIRSLAALIIGAGLGAGIFALLDDDPEPVVQQNTVGIPIDMVTPTVIPFGLPEPSYAEECGALVQQLQDSIQKLQNKPVAQTPVKSSRKKKARGPQYPEPVPGEDVLPR